MTQLQKVTVVPTDKSPYRLPEHIQRGRKCAQIPAALL